jgi:hypothetical protein
MQGNIELQPGKGVRLPLLTDVTTFLASAMQQIAQAYADAGSVEEFWNTIPFPNEAENEKFGKRKWVAMGIRGEELRVAVTLNPKGVLGIDVRTWWQ